MPPEMMTTVAPIAMMAKKRRVGGGLNQRVRVPEVVDRVPGQRIDVRPGEHGQRDRERDEDENESSLLEAEQMSKDASHVIGARGANQRFESAPVCAAWKDSRNRRYGSSYAAWAPGAGCSTRRPLAASRRRPRRDRETRPRRRPRAAPRRTPALPRDSPCTPEGRTRRIASAAGTNACAAAGEQHMVGRDAELLENRHRVAEREAHALDHGPRDVRARMGEAQAEDRAARRRVAMRRSLALEIRAGTSRHPLREEWPWLPR